MGFSLLVPAVWSILSTSVATAKVWFVSASAAANGNGSVFRPFNSLGAVQNASEPNDQIIVLPARASTPPLDGGITLKTGQSLLGADPLSLFAGNNDPALPVSPTAVLLKTVAMRSYSQTMPWWPIL
jgi:hypothetical protein